MNPQYTNQQIVLNSFFHFYGYSRSYDNSEGVIIFNLFFKIYF